MKQIEPYFLKIKHIAFLISAIVLSLCLFPSQALFGQEYENISLFGLKAESDYYLQLRFDFQESDRSTRETGYYDVLQEKDNSELKGNIGLNFAHIDGLYKDYRSTVSIGGDETGLSTNKSSIGSWIEVFDFLYVFGHEKSTGYDYYFIDNLIEKFADSEAAGSSVYGLGMVFGLWRFGLALNSNLSWSYSVSVANTEIISESLDFKVNVFEIIKKSEREPGSFFYELGLKNWSSSGEVSSRAASLSKLEGFSIVGFGISDSSDIYVGQKLTRGSINSQLLSDGSALARNSNYSNSLFGIQFGIGDDSAIYFERDYSDQGISLTNTSFGSQNRYQEHEYTVGYLFNESMVLELKVGRTLYEKSYFENVQNSEDYHYLQVDNHFGLSVHIQFSS